MSIIQIHHGRFFQRQTTEGYALIGVIQADIRLQEAHEYVAYCNGHDLLLDPQAVSGDEALLQTHYDENTMNNTH